MSFYDELLDLEEKEDDDAGLMHGIVVGEVTENWDKDHPGMVKVRLLLGEEGKNSLGWVPVASAYAGNGFGTYFLPEIGSHVIVAFHLGQPGSPYVIGCLWNQTNVLPENTAAEKNTIKTILTKGGSRITISDEEKKEKITVMTKGALSLTLDDENQKASIQDKDGENAFQIDAKNGVINFTAKKKAVFKINGKELLVLDGGSSKAEVSADNIRLKAGQKLELKGQNTALDGSSTNVKGQNVKVEAQASLGLKGTASLKAESSGITEVKGSMLKLN